MLNIKCEMLATELTEPGALLFSPPNEDGLCEKLHLSVEAYEEVLELINDRWIEEFLKRPGPEEVTKDRAERLVKDSGESAGQRFCSLVAARLNTRFNPSAPPRLVLHNVSGVTIAAVDESGVDTYTPQAQNMEIRPVRLGAELTLPEDEFELYDSQGRLDELALTKAAALGEVISDQHLNNCSLVKTVQPSVRSDLREFSVQLFLDQDNWSYTLRAVTEGYYYALPDNYREARPLAS